MARTYYEEATGRIVELTSHDRPLPEREGIGVIPGFYLPDDYYVIPATGEAAPRQDYTLDALPLPCTVTIEGVAYECTEQPTFEFNYPSTYTIHVDAGPAYLKKEFELDYQP